MNDKECMCHTYPEPIKECEGEDRALDEHMHEIPTTLVQDAERFLGEEGKELAKDFLHAWAETFNYLTSCTELFFTINDKMLGEKEKQEKKLSRSDYIDFLMLPQEAFRFFSTYEPLWNEWVNNEEDRAVLEGFKERLRQEQQQKREYN